MIVVIAWQLVSTAAVLVALAANVRSYRRVRRSRGEDAEHLEQAAALVYHLAETHRPADTELRWQADWLALQAERAHILAGHRDAEINAAAREARRRDREAGDVTSARSRTTSCSSSPSTQPRTMSGSSSG